MIARLTPRTAAHVPLLVDPRVPVLQLVRAFTAAGLTLRHDPKRHALLVVPVSDGKEAAHI